MRDVRRILAFVAPYWRLAAASLVMLTTLVGLDLAIPRLVQRILDEGVRRHDKAVIVQTSLLMLGISAVSTVVAIANNVYSVRVGEAVARDLRRALFAKVQAFSFGNLDRERTGELMVRLTSDVGAVKALTQMSLRIGTRAPMLIVGSLALMVATSPRLALELSPLLVATSVLIGFFVARMEPLFLKVQRRLDALNDVLSENVSGVRVVKALVRADHEGARFGAANTELAGQSTTVMKFASSMTPALTMCVNAGVVLVIWVGGLDSIRGGMSLGQLVAFTNYLFTTMSPLVMMTMLTNTWAAGLASSRRMQGILDATPDVVDAPDAVPLVLTGAPRVELVDVSFTYGPGREPALSHVSFVAEPGRTLAILGATGAGKSTLVSLLARFYDASSGEVRVGGCDVKHVTQRSLVAMVGVVPQETVLFSGTVRDNVRYGRPDASDEDVIAAAQAAQADEFIMAMPGGYEARVEQRGKNLSGGQKQRIAIARALLVRPRLLILDDSTSAVDVETEIEIQDALAAGAEERTTIVVAQRISTVLRADRILVLDRGSVVASGTHASLLASSPVYREIYASQLGDADEAAS